MDTNTNMTAKQNTMITTIAEGTIRASIKLMYRNDRWRDVTTLPESEQNRRIGDAVKRTIRDQLDDLTNEWREAIDSGLNEKWLELMVETQCVVMAKAALDSIVSDISD
jgi:hypothetical protein